MKFTTYACMAWLGMMLTAGMARTSKARAGKDKVERTPVLGWSSWSYLRKQPTEAKIEAQARALQSSGLEKLGYKYINLDDFWYQCPGRQGPNAGPYGRWVIDARRFPPQGGSNGIKATADYIHSLGMKFGIYTTPGISEQAVSRNTPIQGTPYTAAQIAEPSAAENNYNCGGMVGINYSKPGAQAYINSWADMFARWGVDYIKLDGIQDSNAPDIEAWAKAIRQSGRPMVLDVTQGSFTQALAPTLLQHANQWEFAPDIECYRCEKQGSSYPLTSWAHVEKRFHYAARWQRYAGPGGFNDYDSIEAGNGANDGLTRAERQTQLSLWALAASPLILGSDLTHLNPVDLQYLKNTAVLAVDQDAIAAKRILNAGSRQIFAKTEPNGDAIIGLFNTGEKAEEVAVAAHASGLPESGDGYTVKNLWTGKTEKTMSIIGAIVPAHGVVLYRVRALCLLR